MVSCSGLFPINTSVMSSVPPIRFPFLRDRDLDLDELWFHFGMRRLCQLHVANNHYFRNVIFKMILNYCAAYDVAPVHPREVGKAYVNSSVQRVLDPLRVLGPCRVGATGCVGVASCMHQTIGHMGRAIQDMERKTRRTTSKSSLESDGTTPPLSEDES